MMVSMSILCRFCRSAKRCQSEIAEALRKFDGTYVTVRAHLSHDCVRRLLMSMYDRHRDLAGVFRCGIDRECSVAENVTEDPRVLRLHVRDGPVSDLVDAATEEVLILKNEPHVRDVDDVVTVVEPRAPEEYEGEE